MGSGADGTVYEARPVFPRGGRVAYLNRNDDERNFYVNGQDNDWNFQCRVLLRNALQSL